MLSGEGGAGSALHHEQVFLGQHHKIGDGLREQGVEFLAVLQSGQAVVAGQAAIDQVLLVAARVGGDLFEGVGQAQETTAVARGEGRGEEDHNPSVLVGHRSANALHGLSLGRERTDQGAQPGEEGLFQFEVEAVEVLTGDHRLHVLGG